MTRYASTTDLGRLGVATQALSGSFNKDFVLHYTMKDADGDTSSSTLTINRARVSPLR